MSVTPADLAFTERLVEEAVAKLDLAHDPDTHQWATRDLRLAQALRDDVRAQLGAQNIAQAAEILGATIVTERKRHA